MKFVITYPCGDEYTASWEGVTCIEYESEEKLLCDIHEWAVENKDKLFMYCGTGFKDTDLFPCNYLDNIEYNLFEIRTLEKWFEDSKMKEQTMEVVINGDTTMRPVDRIEYSEFGVMRVPVLYSGEVIMQMIDGTTHIVRMK